MDEIGRGACTVYDVLSLADGMTVKEITEFLSKLPPTAKLYIDTQVTPIIVDRARMRIPVLVRSAELKGSIS